MASVPAVELTEALLAEIRAALPSVKVRAAPARRLHRYSTRELAGRQAAPMRGPDPRLSALFRPADPRARCAAAQVPGAYDTVYNDECLFSTDTPFAPGGIFISLTTWRAYTAADARKRAPADRLFLNLAFSRVPKEQPPADAKKEAEPTKLAIGVDGGFDADSSNEETRKERSLLVMPAGVRIALPCPELPELVLRACEAIETHASAHEQAQVGAWEEEVKPSRYAKDLPQEDGVKISPDPSTWVCAESGLRENLWLNLSDGYIGSGRAQAYGVGGTGAALRHYEELAAQGKHYPLVVKLGTISAKGGRHLAAPAVPASPAPHTARQWRRARRSVRRALEGAAP